jgi:uncharacterized protein with von Willebrand factor type A (vWA) domain
MPLHVNPESVLDGLDDLDAADYGGRDLDDIARTATLLRQEEGRDVGAGLLGNLNDLDDTAEDEQDQEREFDAFFDEHFADSDENPDEIHDLWAGCGGMGRLTEKMERAKQMRRFKPGIVLSADAA